MTTNPYVRPDDYGIPITAQHHDDKTVRNIKLPWQEIKRHANPLWEKGYQFYCVTPKTRHRVHSQWSVNDWVQIYESNFGDPYRMDKRTPGWASTSCTSTRRRRKTAGSMTATTCMWTGTR